MSDTPRTDALMSDMNEGWPDRWAKSHAQLERELAEAVAKERERCARVCEERGSFNSMYAHHILPLMWLFFATNSHPCACADFNRLFKSLLFDSFISSP